MRKWQCHSRTVRWRAVGRPEGLSSLRKTGVRQAMRRTVKLDQRSHGASRHLWGLSSIGWKWNLIFNSFCIAAAAKSLQSCLTLLLANKKERSMPSKKLNFIKFFFRIENKKTLLKVLATQSLLNLWDPLCHSRPGSSVHGILQARILEWVAMLFSRGSSWPGDQTWVSQIAGRFFTIWANRESPLRELTPKKDVLFIIGDWNTKVGNQETPGVTGKFGLGVQNEEGILPRECPGQSKHPLSATQEKTRHMDITRCSILKSDWLYSLQSMIEKLYIVSKNKTGSWLWLRSWTPYCQIQT